MSAGFSTQGFVDDNITTVPNTLRALSEAQRERSVVLAFQTIVRDYLDATTRAAYEHDMRRWLEDAPA